MVPPCWPGLCPCSASAGSSLLGGGLSGGGPEQPPSSERATRQTADRTQVRSMCVLRSGGAFAPVVGRGASENGALAAQQMQRVEQVVGGQEGQGGAPSGRGPGRGGGKRRGLADG